LIDDLVNYLIDLSNIFSFGLLEESCWDILSRGSFLKHAEELICVTVTSLPCERLFSVSGILLEKKITALTPENVKEILSLNSRLK